MSKKWYAIANQTQDSADVTLYDEIGGWGVSAKDFIKDIQGLAGKHINLRINSPGGSIVEGQAIIAALKRHTAGFTAWVDGLAASMASVIACAASKCYMADGAMMMVHRASTVSYGDADDLRKDAALLEKFEKSIVNVYAGKTGMDEEEINALLKEETWMDALEAVALGFADGVSDAPEAFALLTPADMRARFDKFKNGMDKEPSNQEEVKTEEVAEVATEVKADETQVYTEEGAEVKTEEKVEAENTIDANVILNQLVEARVEIGELKAKLAAKDAEFEKQAELLKLSNKLAGIAPANVVIQPVVGKTAAQDLLEQWEAIKDPAEKTAFYKKHEAKLKAAAYGSAYQPKTNQQ